MRSLSPETSRKASDPETLSEDNTTSTQHGIREHGLSASPGSLSRGKPEENTVPESWEDSTSTKADLAAGHGDNGGKQSKLSASSPPPSGRIAEYESTTPAVKSISDGTLFKVVAGASKLGKRSPIANLPNGKSPTTPPYTL